MKSMKHQMKIKQKKDLKKVNVGVKGVKILNSQEDYI